MKFIDFDKIAQSSRKMWASAVALYEEAARRLKEAWAGGCAKIRVKAPVIAGKVKEKCVNAYRYVEGLSFTKKMFCLMLFIIVSFILWQFFATTVQMTTFVAVNLALAFVLTTVTCYVIVTTQRELAAKIEEIDHLEREAEKRANEFNKVRSDLFELRNRNRRQSQATKGSSRLVEAIKQLKAKQGDCAPDTKLQFVVDAICQSFDVSGAIAYLRRDDDAEVFDVAGSYALSDLAKPEPARAGEGFVGQAIHDGKALALPNVPTGYLTAVSGLGRSKSLNVYVLPFADSEGNVVAVAEVASFTKLLVVERWDEISEALREVF